MRQKNYGIICDVGGKGKGNQDSAFYQEFDLIIAPGDPDSKEFTHKCILALVCDGVSASNHGEKGSSFVIRILSSKIMNIILLNNFTPSNLHNQIKQAILETNKQLMQKYQDYIESGKVPKTTLVGLLTIGQYIWTFNLGDSRAYLVKDDLIGQVSVDHVGTGATHEITQAMGQDMIKPEIKFYNWAFENDHYAQKRAFKQDYYALICSDGLTDVINSEEIKDHLRDSSINSVQKKVQKLYQLAMERDIEDNVSIIAINLAQYLSELSKVEILKLSYPKK